MDAAQILGREAFFADMPEAQRAVLAGCAEPVDFAVGEYLLRQNQSADVFYLILGGHVALKAYVPQQGAQPVETLGPHDPLGWSWLLPPYRWHFDARALEPTQALRFDAVCLRQKMDNDHELGFQMLSRFLPVVVHRLQGARVQALDLYREPSRSAL